MAIMHSLAFLLVLAGSVHRSTVCAQQECQPSGVLQHPSDSSDHTCPPGQDPSPTLSCCNPNSSTCCVAGGQYPQYSCSPPVTASTPAIMTLNSFVEGHDGGGEASCTGSYFQPTEPLVALSSGWYNYNLCLQNIAITANGITVMAKVVDKCDSEKGCDEVHNYQVPCRQNVVDASKPVWDALGISSDVGETPITWAPL